MPRHLNEARGQAIQTRGVGWGETRSRCNSMTKGSDTGMHLVGLRMTAHMMEAKKDDARLCAVSAAEAETRIKANSLDA